MADDRVTTIRGRIDPDSPVPYYFQLRELIRAEIDDGRWPHGARIPSEHELCEMLDVSRTVVRQALGGLVDEALLRRRKGLGTFVAEPKISGALIQRLTGFHEDMLGRGFTPRTRVLEQGVVPADELVADRLGIPASDPVVRIERMRSIAETPIVLVTTYLPHDLVQGLEDAELTNRSLYQTLDREFGLHIAHGRRMLEAVAADRRDARWLDVHEGEPMLFLRSVTYLQNGRAIEYYEARHRGDRTVLEVDLVRDDAEASAHRIDVRNGP